LSTSFAELLVVGFFLGIAGASFAVSLPLASRAYPLAHQGLAMGVAGSGNSGAILSVALAPLLAERLGWHAVFGMMIPMVGMAAVVYWLLARDHDSAGMGQTKLRSLLADRDTYLFCLLYS